MKKKIIILLLALFLFFLGGLGIALYMVFQTTAHLDALINLHKVEIIRQELVINVQTVQSNLYTTGTQFGKELDVIVDNVLHLRRSARSCGDCHHEPEVAAKIGELQEMAREYEEALSYFITSTADKTRIERLQTVAADIGDAIIAKSQEMAMAANETLQRKTIAARARVNQSKSILAATIVLAFLLSSAVAFYLIVSITRPVAELLAATRKIRGGQLGYISTYRGHDEFRELIESFNDMSDSLKQTNEKILAHMSRNQTILQTSIDGFLLFAEDGRILDANPAFCTMTGYSRSELLQMKFTDIEMLHPLPSEENLLKRIKRARSVIFQVEQKTKKGTMINVEISATYAEMDGGGNYFCFIRDITPRRKMEEELLKVQKLESLGILAGGLAHDFNNLLTGILGNIDLVKLYLKPDEKAAGWLNNAIKASRRAQNLTHQLLTFSKGGTPVMQLVRLDEMLEESIPFVLSGSNVRFETEVPGDTWLIKADKGQISQVIQNITINAKQAMPEGGTLRVRVENVALDESAPPPLPTGKYVKISFTDEGGGIEPQNLAKIYDPYFTTKPTGSGLGLAICYSIVSKHHGLLKTDSVLGQGTTFTIFLPALSDQTLAGTAAGQEEIFEGSGRVLVMDDEEQVRQIAADMLLILGYEPEVARDGDEALAVYREALAEGRPFKAVIMDLTVPGGMSGQEALRKLKEIDPGVKAIVSSGYSNDPIMADYRDYGFQGVVTKPYDIRLLGRTLAALFND